MAAMAAFLLLSTPLLTAASTAAATCAQAAEPRQAAAQLYATGQDADADECLTFALANLTAQLEIGKRARLDPALAAEAETVHAYREARRRGATLRDDASGCVRKKHRLAQECAPLCTRSAKTQFSLCVFASFSEIEDFMSPA
eukprot:4008031-Pleurochrysis_carterae.AAC.1